MRVLKKHPNPRVSSEGFLRVLLRCRRWDPGGGAKGPPCFGPMSTHLLRWQAAERQHLRLTHQLLYQHSSTRLGCLCTSSCCHLSSRLGRFMYQLLCLLITHASSSWLPRKHWYFARVRLLRMHCHKLHLRPLFHESACSPRTFEPACCPSVVTLHGSACPPSIATSCICGHFSPSPLAPQASLNPLAPQASLLAAWVRLPPKHRYQLHLRPLFHQSARSPPHL